MASGSKRALEPAISTDEEVSDREDITVEEAGDMIASYEVFVYNSNEEKVKILQDTPKRHNSFEARSSESPSASKESGNTTSNSQKKKKKRGPKAAKYATKCKDRSQSRYKRRNGVIKSIRDLKVKTADDSIVCFFKHPVDGSADERTLYATTTELIRKFKSLECGERVVPNILQESPSNESLQLATPSKVSNSNRKTNQKERNESNMADFCRICDVKYNSKMDRDYESPWLGCEEESCDHWVHLNCLGFVSEDAENLSEWYCKKHHPKKMPTQRRVIKKR